MNALLLFVFTFSFVVKGVISFHHYSGIRALAATRVGNEGSYRLKGTGTGNCDNNRGSTPNLLTLNADTRAQIEHAISSNPVVLFMKGTKVKPSCGFSQSACHILKTIGIPYTTIDVLEGANADLRQGLKVYSDWPTFPQLYVRGVLVGGADIIKEMHGSGALSTLIKGQGDDKQ